jgi:hypothetical protein
MAKEGGGMAGGSQGSGGTNVWDVGRALLVIGGLVYLTVFLVRHYPEEKNVAAILGIVAPVLAAVVGVSVGYATGNTTGKAQGEAGKAAAVKDGRNALAVHVKSLIDGSGAEVAVPDNVTVEKIRSAIGAVETE